MPPVGIRVQQQHGPWLNNWVKSSKSWRTGSRSSKEQASDVLQVLSGEVTWT